MDSKGSIASSESNTLHAKDDKEGNHKGNVDGDASVQKMVTILIGPP